MFFNNQTEVLFLHDIETLFQILIIAETNKVFPKKSEHILDDSTKFRKRDDTF
jgi:hypothetical protein